MASVSSAGRLSRAGLLGVEGSLHRPGGLGAGDQLHLVAVALQHQAPAAELVRQRLGGPFDALRGLPQDPGRAPPG